jgi:hypothetical protein
LVNNEMVAAETPLLAETIWSPLFNSAMQVARIAAIPERGGDAGFAAFQRRQPLLKHPHGRIGEAGIDVAREPCH